MTQIGFYHLTRFSLEQALPKLLEKAYGGKMRVVVLTSSPERVTALNAFLWAYRDDSFLPHGGAQDGAPQDQPIYLTHTLENPNQATVLVLCDGADAPDPAGFDRVLNLFDGNNETAVQAARGQWKRWKDASHHLVYYQQTQRGGWEKKQEGVPAS